LPEQTFSAEEIDSRVRQSDFRNYRTILSKDTRETLVSDAVNIASACFAPACGLKYRVRKGRIVCFIDNYPSILVLRKISENLATVSNAYPSERSRIIKVLTLVLREETSYRIYRLDVRRFFESLSKSTVLAAVESTRVSQQTKSLLRFILNEHVATGNTGIPTGLAISSTLAEIMMLPFDDYVKTLPCTLFAARFVDDIILITTGEENSASLLESLKAKLPLGAHFNEEKYAQIDVERRKLNNISYRRFEYLGYSFQVRDNVVNPKLAERVVDVDLSERTVKRQLSRLAKAFRAYVKDGNFDDLQARIRYLTSNYRLFDTRVSRKRLAGIFHNHPFLTYHPGNSLSRLDTALRNLAHSGSQLRAGAGVALTASQRQALSQRSFLRGHRAKEYYCFSIKKLALVKRCWFDG